MFWMTRYVKRGRNTANESSNKASANLANLANKRRRWRLERQDAFKENSEDQEDNIPAPRQLSPVDSGLGVEMMGRSPRLQNLGPAFHRSLDWSSIPEEGGEARLVHSFSARTKFDAAPCVAAHIALTDRGDIVVSDVANKNVKVFDVSGQLKVECCVPLYYSGGLVEPRGVVALETGEIVVSDGTNGNIKLFTPEGRLLTMFGKILSKPTDMAVNSRGHIVVIDENKRDAFLFKSLTDKKVTRLLREDDQGHISFGHPTAVCMTTADDIIVFDETSKKLVVCDESGNYCQEHSLKCLRLEENVTAEANIIGSCEPYISAVCTENHNTILVADRDNNRIASVNIKTGELCRDVIFKTQTISKPLAIASNEEGLLVVLEESQQNVKVFKYNR